MLKEEIGATTMAIDIITAMKTKSILTNNTIRMPIQELLNCQRIHV